jgi:hypothetical protein
MQISENRKDRTNATGNPEQFAGAVSLKDVPIEERRKEADKPLYLTRYE